MKAVYLLIRAAKVFTLLFFIGVLLYIYFFLPEQMGVHFNEWGHADNYLPKSQFFYGAGLFIILFNVAVSLLGRFLTALPPKLLPVPHRDLWSATAETRNAFNYVLRNWLNGFVTVINVLLVATLLVLMQVNTEMNADIEDYAWVFVTGIVLVLVWLVYLPLRLLKRPGAVVSNQ
jgi:uncharacterized membrane protein